MAQDTQDKAPAKGENYLAGLSNKTLDAMYASASRACGNGEPNQQMREIEAEMEKRYNEFSSKGK
jgi:hypothetical protein